MSNGTFVAGPRGRTLRGPPRPAHPRACGRRTEGCRAGLLLATVRGLPISPPICSRSEIGLGDNHGHTLSDLQTLSHTQALPILVYRLKGVSDMARTNIEIDDELVE